MLEETIGKYQAIKSLIEAVLSKKGLLDEQLQICVVIIDSFDGDEREKFGFDRFRDIFEGILNNLDFNRELQKLKIINTNVELALAYYGVNFGRDENVDYNEDLQKGILGIEKNIREFLGLVMNNILKQEVLEI